MLNMARPLNMICSVKYVVLWGFVVGKDVVLLQQGDVCAQDWQCYTNGLL